MDQIIKDTPTDEVDAMVVTFFETAGESEIESIAMAAVLDDGSLLSAYHNCTPETLAALAARLVLEANRLDRKNERDEIDDDY